MMCKECSSKLARSSVTYILIVYQFGHIIYTCGFKIFGIYSQAGHKFMCNFPIVLSVYLNFWYRLVSWDFVTRCFLYNQDKVINF